MQKIPRPLYATLANDVEVSLLMFDWELLNAAQTLFETTPATTFKAFRAMSPAEQVKLFYQVRDDAASVVSESPAVESRILQSNELFPILNYPQKQVLRACLDVDLSHRDSYRSVYGTAKHLVALALDDPSPSLEDSAFKTLRELLLQGKTRYDPRDDPDLKIAQSLAFVLRLFWDLSIEPIEQLSDKDNLDLARLCYVYDMFKN